MLGQDVIVSMKFCHIWLKHLEDNISVDNWSIEMGQTSSCMSREALSYGISYVMMIVVDGRQDRQTPFVLLVCYLGEIQNLAKIRVTVRLVCVCVCVCVNICVRIFVLNALEVAIFVVSSSNFHRMCAGPISRFLSLFKVIGHRSSEL